MKTAQEINEQIEMAETTEDPCFGMTYEEGVVAALLWVTDERDDPPVAP